MTFVTLDGPSTHSAHRVGWNRGLGYTNGPPNPRFKELRRLFHSFIGPKACQSQNIQSVQEEENIRCDPPRSCKQPLISKPCQDSSSTSSTLQSVSRTTTESGSGFRPVRPVMLMYEIQCYRCGSPTALVWLSSVDRRRRYAWPCQDCGRRNGRILSCVGARLVG